LTETAIPQNATGEAQPLKLGRYEIMRELGKGAMGVVYLARDPLISRSVALKTIRLAEGVDEDDAREFRERFLREAQAAGALNHPNIVMVHDIGQDADTGYSYIAMEFAEGKNLKEILGVEEPLTYAEMAEIAAQVADALDYAHSKGVVHRDVKPANIIMCDGRAKITDFGIAKIASSVTNLTSTGQFLGTPNYMAPEQVKGTRVDGRTDIFSLGIVLYEGLSRRKPFGGDSLTTISYKIVHEPFQSLRDIDARIPPGFDQIVAKCLTKDPGDRYQRARDLADDLRRVARGEAPLVAAGDEMVESGTLLNVPNLDDDATLSMPFPEVAASATAIAGAPAGVSAPLPEVAKRPGALRKRVPRAVFLGVLAGLLLVLGAVLFSLWRGRVDVPAVDSKKEAAVMRQRKLRVEGEQALRAGNLEAAYYKYRELLTLAPASQATRQKLAEIEEKRILAMTERQREEQAQLQFDQAKALFDERKYDEAIELFEESLLLNPGNPQALEYVRIAQEFQTLKKQSEQSSKVAQKRAATTTAGGELPTPAPRGTGTLRTVFDSPINDGYILVKVNGNDVVWQRLYEERRGILRRLVPRKLSVTNEIPSGELKIETLVVVPKLKINERRTLPTVTIRPGSTHSLTFSLDVNTKQVSVNFS
jgi:predicted Ser/Thr protein kinase